MRIAIELDADGTFRCASEPTFEKPFGSARAYNEYITALLLRARERLKMEQNL